MNNKVLYLSGLDDILNNKEMYESKGYKFDICKLVNFMSVKDSIIRRQFISVMYMIDCVEIEKDNIDKISRYQYDPNKKIKNRNIQDTIYNYLAKIDSLTDYIDKLSNKLNVIKFNRKEIDAANNINNYRNEILHEGIPYIHSKNIGENNYGHEETTCCCQIANDVIYDYSFIEVELITGNKINLQTIIDSTYSPIKREINNYFIQLLENN